ncbi:MAG: hypothetical protein WA851_00200 [Xanthobacteraceae bacterium]
MQDLAQKTHETLDFCAEAGSSRDPDNVESPQKQGVKAASPSGKFGQLIENTPNLPCQPECAEANRALRLYLLFRRAALRNLTA